MHDLEGVSKNSSFSGGKQWEREMRARGFTVYLFLYVAHEHVLMLLSKENQSIK
jgi:hypothetical protein